MQISSQTVFSSPQAIESDLARALEQIPAMAGLLEPFGLLLIERSRLREAAPGWTVPPPPIDPDRFSQGAFLLADSGFLDMSPQLREAASTLLPVMAGLFPSLADALDSLASGLASGAVDPAALVAAGFGEPGDILGIDPRILLFAGSELVRPFVERQAQDLLPLVKDLPWRHACCPVCGGAPNMSVMRRTFDPSEFIQAHGGRRYLRCSRCSVEWTYKRVSCPVCCCEEPEELAVLRDAARPYERVDACKRCKSFLLCLDAGELAAVPDPDVAALGMSALESRAVREGFVPMARHPWSGLLG